MLQLYTGGVMGSRFYYVDCCFTRSAMSDVACFHVACYIQPYGKEKQAI